MPKATTGAPRRLPRPAQSPGDEGCVSESGDHEAEETEFGGEEDGAGEVE